MKRVFYGNDKIIDIYYNNDKGDEDMGKKKKFCSNGTGIPVAANYHFFDLQQVVEWTTICLDGDKIKNKLKKEQEWKSKEEKKGKMVILIK